MTARSEELEDMAWECRALAYTARHAAVREQLLEVAEQFDRLAQQHESRTLVHSKPDTHR